MSSSSRVFYGKYRGQVTDNKDPKMLGRVRAKVPAVFGDEETGWAMPCAPYAGNGVGFFFVPPVGANVWIEFEAGNPEEPICSGCFWGIGETPKIPAVPDVKVIKTDAATITINDLPGGGGVTIETTTGLKIVMDAKGIELSNGSASVKLSPASVSINNGALEVI
jgi:uncharacterized protein involved in type VI secretion and phage assembly